MGDTNTGSERPDIEELYQTASNTSNLKVEAERRGSGDVLIAAGWSASRVGMALLRLHSEWDASEKPLKPTKESVRALVGTFQRNLPGEKTVAVTKGEKAKPLTGTEAQHYAAAWYAHEVGMLLGKLKGLPSVREQLTVQALKWRMGLPDDPEARHELLDLRKADAKLMVTHQLFVDTAPEGQFRQKAEAVMASFAKESEQRREQEQQLEYHRAAAKASEVVRYWLDQTCKACCGLRWQLVPGAPALSGRTCTECKGRGVSEVPHEEQGKRLANWLDSCVEDARGTVKKNLANWRQARNKVVDTKGGRVIIPAEDGTGR